MTEVIRLALYTEVLGPRDSDCAGGRAPIDGHWTGRSTPTRRTKHLSSVDYFLVWLYLYMSVIHSDKQRQGLVCQFLSRDNYYHQVQRACLLSVYLQTATITKSSERDRLAGLGSGSCV